ncbi:hypothetical protein F8M41_019932 [Gigaspora margarita]|uniref:Uncharacterized protein n=1 Tax=Gigaspora margarita TaxID=4874 RepID=A0A8H4EK49_GIGMA|nr:hypothetical protein F8M41_019932 [Gigaspora margarita]
MNGSTYQNIHVQPQINNGQPQGLHIINIGRQLRRPQNNANRINNTFINDLINGMDPVNIKQCPPQQNTEFSKSLFSGTSFP